MKKFSFKEITDASFIDLKTGEKLLSLKNLKYNSEGITCFDGFIKKNKYPTPVSVKLNKQYYEKLNSKKIDLVLDPDGLNPIRFDGIPVVLDDTVDKFEFVYEKNIE